jgi:hypothetical protein
VTNAPITDEALARFARQREKDRERSRRYAADPVWRAKKREYDALYRAANREKLREYTRTFNLLNPHYRPLYRASYVGQIICTKGCRA